MKNKEKVAEAVGIGAVIFQELSHSRIKDYMFSWDTSLSFEGETGPYVQYTHARANSVLEKAAVYDYTDIFNNSTKIETLLETELNYQLLVEEETFSILKIIYKLPEVIIKAMERNEPFLLTRQIIDLAQAFNKFYHEYPILVDDPELKKARLLLVLTTKNVLKTGLKLLGIKAPDKM